MSDLFHDAVPLDFIEQVFDVIRETPQHTYQILTKRAQRLSRLASKLDWPLNLWMGVSVESAKYKFRVDHLRRVPAAVRFVSAEPLLGPLGEINLEGIHWVIAGGESGPHARRVEYDWVADLRDSATTAHVAFFFKQWGGRTPKAGGRELDGEVWDQLPVELAS
jgi:protein gp37